MTAKAWPKEKTDKLDIVKIKHVCTSMNIIKKVKRNPQKGRKYLEIIYLKRHLYVEYIKNYYDSKITRQLI